jgi:hypothetical protein
LTGIRRARRDGRRLRLPALRERRPGDVRSQSEGAGRRRSPSLPGCRGQATLARAPLAALMAETRGGLH